MKKRLSLLLSLAAALGLMFSSAGSPGITPAQAAETGTTQTTTSTTGQKTEKKTEKKKEDTVLRSILTNEKIDPEIAKQRPIAVMYPINYEAQPQYGLSNVDVFYEMIEEGNMSRQMGIIQDWKNIGQINIRSTRSYFVKEAMRYDPIMIHFGGPIDWLKPVTDRPDLDNLNGVGGILGGDYGAFYRVNNGKAMETPPIPLPTHHQRLRKCRLHPVDPS